jgi:CHAT domain-containing protein
VRRERTSLTDERSKIPFRVALSSLTSESTYRLIVRSAEADEPLLKMTFIPVFAPRKNDIEDHTAPGPSAVRDTSRCSPLDEALKNAEDRYYKREWESAGASYQEILESAVAERCRLQEARAHNGLAVLAIQAGRLVDGFYDVKRGSEALEDGDELPRQEVFELMAKLEHTGGMASLRLGWLEEARDAARRLLSVRDRQNAGPVERADALLLSIRAHRLLGDAPAAQRALQRANELLADLEPDVRASLWQEQARLDLDAERFADAKEALDQAMAAVEGQEPRWTANLLVDFAELEMRRESWRDSLERANETLDLIATAGFSDLSLEALARYIQTVALTQLGKLDEAIWAAEKGLAVLEAARSAWQDLGLHFFALRQDYYRHRLDLAVAAEGPNELWTAFEAHRARGLVESLHTRLASPASDDERPEEEERLVAQAIAAIRELDRRAPGSGGERLLLEARFRARQQELRWFRAEQLRAAGRSVVEIVEPQDARDLLDDDTLGLVFVPGTRRIHVLVLDPVRGLELVQLPTDNRQIFEKIDDLTRSLNPIAVDEIAARFKPAARDLGRDLLAPLEGRLDKFQRLVIVAGGELEPLPFEVLLDPRSGRQLIENHEIVYLPSFSVLAALRKRASTCPPATSNLLAIADPVFSERDTRWTASTASSRSLDEAVALERLPVSAEEAEAITALYPKGSRLLSGKEATRERFLEQAPAYRVIHVASHARTDARIPERSKIALSCIDQDDQPIETCDVYFADVVHHLDLCSQVVVLSACTTAGGKLLAGEGTLGLPRAFLRAGASTVVASLWRVGDEATRPLMAQFHRYLRDTGEPGAALRTAKLDRVEAGRPPSDWAAFVVLGDWRSETLPSTFPAPSGPIDRNAP